MAKTTPSELEDWDEIVKAITSNNIEVRAGGNANATKKLVLSIVNLQEALLSHQQKTTRGLNDLTKSIDKFNENSGKLVAAGLILSLIIAVATVAQVVVAIIK